MYSQATSRRLRGVSPLEDGDGDGDVSFDVGNARVKEPIVHHDDALDWIRAGRFAADDGNLGPRGNHSLDDDGYPFDCVVSNLPYGHAISLGGLHDGYAATADQEAVKVGPVTCNLHIHRKPPSVDRLTRRGALVSHPSPAGLKRALSVH